MAKKKQIDQTGYTEGYRTGLMKGYDRGIEDGLKAMLSILDHNGIIMKESEFYLELETLKEEGNILPIEG